MKKKHFDPKNKLLVEAMIAEVLNTRMFCGNEYNVYREWASFYDVTEQQWFDHVITAVNREWDRCRKEVAR